MEISPEIQGCWQKMPANAAFREYFRHFGNSRG